MLFVTYSSAASLLQQSHMQLHVSTSAFSTLHVIYKILAVEWPQHGDNEHQQKPGWSPRMAVNLYLTDFLVN